MNRIVHHSAHVDLPFDAVCEVLSSGEGRIFQRATAAAASATDELVVRLDRDIPFFRVNENVRIQVGPLERTGDVTAMVPLDWSADSSLRVLPRLDARLSVHGVIPRGPKAITTISAVGTFEAPRSLRHRLEDRALSRRLVDRAVSVFVHTLAGEIATQLDTPISA